MLIYNGVRISELLDLEKENVHLDEHYFPPICYTQKTESISKILFYVYCSSLACYLSSKTKYFPATPKTSDFFNTPCTSITLRFISVAGFALCHQIRKGSAKSKLLPNLFIFSVAWLIANAYIISLRIV